MGKKILIVDDSPTVRQQVRMALEGAGFDVEEAVDGMDGKERIGRNAQLAAVVCDVNMPRMNGIEMIESVKSDPRNGKLPIVMLTTEGQAALVKRAKAAGATGWMIKPFNASLLIATIKKLVEAA
jgi:two-component system, chemotaxis family, chemotaxis protein CheY